MKHSATAAAASLPPYSACVPPAQALWFPVPGNRTYGTEHPSSSSPLPSGRISEDWNEPAQKALGKQQGQCGVAEGCQGVRRRAGAEQTGPRSFG